MTLTDLLHGLNFKGFKNIDLGDVLASFSEMHRISGLRSNRTMGLKLLVKCVLRPERFVLSAGEASILLAFVSASANRRKDIREIRENILALGVPMQTLDARAGLFPTFIDTIPALGHLLSWHRTLCAARVPRKWRISVMDRLLSLWRFDKFCSRHIQFHRLRLATVFYDAESLHNFFVRKCKEKGIATATLQHGVILAPRKEVPDNVDFSGIEFRCSCADFFLAWNPFTIDEGIKAGMEDRRFLLVGSSRTLGHHSVTPLECKRSNRFGVLLDGIFTAESNPLLLDIATQVSNQSGKQISVRYHPRFHGDEYRGLLQSDSVSDRAEPIHDWCSKLDFAIATNSTAVMELLHYGVPVYLFSSGGNKEKYRDICVPKFRSATELLELLRADQSGKLQALLRKQLLFSGDSKMAYRAFFKRFS